MQGLVATVGRPIQNSLPRVLGGRDRFIRRADLNFKTVFLVAMATVEGPCGGGSRSILPFIWCKHIVLKSLNILFELRLHWKSSRGIDFHFCCVIFSYFPFLDALASLGSILESDSVSQSVIHVFEI